MTLNFRTFFRVTCVSMLLLHAFTRSLHEIKKREKKKKVLKY